MYVIVQRLEETYGNLRYPHLPPLCTTYGLPWMISMYVKEINCIEEKYMRMTCVGNTFVHKKEYDVRGN